MMNPSSALESLSSADLLSATREIVEKSRGLEAELLLHLGEVDERKLYLECAFPSMFAFCVEELGFSEDAAYARITVARAARRLPAVVEAVRSGQVHLTGLRMLVPHLTDQNLREILAQAAGQVEARRRRVGGAAFAAAGCSCADPQAPRASGSCDGAAGAGDGRSATNRAALAERCSRHIPDAIKRAVYERDGGRCTFTDERGRRCGETGALEFDHVDGFARTHRHDVDGIRLLCRAHNQHAAVQVYGRAFMERARAPPTAS
jgi:hypothetical protein